MSRTDFLDPCDRSQLRCFAEWFEALADELLAERGGRRVPWQVRRHKSGTTTEVSKLREQAERCRKAAAMGRKKPNSYLQWLAQDYDNQADAAEARQIARGKQNMDSVGTGGRSVTLSSG
jgi:hypothetical protein